MEQEFFWEDIETALNDERVSVFPYSEVWNNGKKEYMAELEFYSPAGEDFVFDIWHNNTKKGFVRAVEQFAKGFDVDEHAELWIPSRGTDGVPSTIQEILDDAKLIQEKLNIIVNKLQRFKYDLSLEGKYNEETKTFSQYMGNDPGAKYEIKNYGENDKLAVNELSYMNAVRDKGEKGYMGAELLFRVRHCTTEMINEIEEPLCELQTAFKNALDEAKAGERYTDRLIRNGVSLCCDVVPYEYKGKTLMNVSFKYINFNPWAKDELSENDICNGRPKDLELHGGFITPPVDRIHIGYFPQVSLELNGLDTKDFAKSFIKEYGRKAGAFRMMLQQDFRKFGKEFTVPYDDSQTMTLLSTVTTLTANKIRMKLENEVAVTNLAPDEKANTNSQSYTKQ